MPNILWAFIPVVGPLIGGALEESGGGKAEPEPRNFPGRIFAQEDFAEQANRGGSGSREEVYRGVRLRNMGNGDTEKLKRIIDEILSSAAASDFSRQVKRINYDDHPYHADLGKTVNGWADGGHQITIGTGNTDGGIKFAIGHEAEHNRLGHYGYDEQQEAVADYAGIQFREKCRQKSAST